VWVEVAAVLGLKRGYPKRVPLRGTRRHHRSSLDSGATGLSRAVCGAVLAWPWMLMMRCEAASASDNQRILSGEWSRLVGSSTGGLPRATRDGWQGGGNGALSRVVTRSVGGAFGVNLWQRLRGHSGRVRIRIQVSPLLVSIHLGRRHLGSVILLYSSATFGIIDRSFLANTSQRKLSGCASGPVWGEAVSRRWQRPTHLVEIGTGASLNACREFVVLTS